MIWLKFNRAGYRGSVWLNMDWASELREQDPDEVKPGDTPGTEIVLEDAGPSQHVVAVAEHPDTIISRVAAARVDIEAAMERLRVDVRQGLV